MSARTSRKLATATALALLGSIAGAGAAAASDPLELPAGTACAFPLGVEAAGGNSSVRTFTGKDGRVRVLTTGTGSALTFTNLDSGATLSLRSNGATGRTTLLPDGSATIVSGGHNVLILYPSDVPAGPSTVLYTGRYVVTVAPDGVWTLQSSHGTSRDLCAELSG